MTERPNRWTNLVRPQVRDGIRAQVRADGAGEVLIYDVIDEWGAPWGVSAGDVMAALDGLGDVSALAVRLNSPGGSYFDGVTIAHALARHPATVTVHVDGLAASAASVVAMGGDRIVMGQGSQMMIHEASSMAWGSADEIRRTADMLDQTNDDIAALYAQRAGGEVATWREAVRAETWYTAAQAVEAGLADEVVALPSRTEEAAAAVAARAADLLTATRQDVEDAPALASMVDAFLAKAAAAAAETPADEAVARPPATLPAAGSDLSELLCSAIREGVG